MSRCPWRACLGTAVLLVTALSSISSCTGLERCDRDGCQAVDQPARSHLVYGMAGSVATMSDIVENGCQECRLATGKLQIWASSTRITSAEEAQALRLQSASAQEIAIDEHFEEALPPGEYLVCIDDGSPCACAGITVPSAGVVTVHLRFVFGPAALIVFEPGATKPREDRLFTLVRPE